MALRPVFLRKVGNTLEIEPDPVIVESRDKLVWLSKDGDHKGNFLPDVPPDAFSDLSWTGDRNQPSKPKVEVLVDSGTFPYKAEIIGIPSRNSEVVVVGSR